MREVNGGHRVRDWASADAFLRAGRGCPSERRIGHNTICRRVGRGFAGDCHSGPDYGRAPIAIKYHATDVVTFHYDGTVSITTGGWDTLTTWDRIRTFTPHLKIWGRRVGSESMKCVFDPGAPLTAARVTRCRTCKGTGEQSYTTGGYRRWAWWPDAAPGEMVPLETHTAACRLCAGAGTYDYGSNVDPLIFRDGMRFRADGSVVVGRNHYTRVSDIGKRKARAVKVSDGRATFYKAVVRHEAAGLVFGSPLQVQDPVIYVPGEIADAGEVDLDPDVSCSRGINITRTPDEARQYGPVVLTVKIPKGTKYVDTGHKLRTRRVRVVGVHSQ